MDDGRPKKIKKRRREADEQDDDQPEEQDVENRSDASRGEDVNEDCKMAADDNEDDDRSGDPLVVEGEDEEMAHKRRTLMKAQKKFSIALIEEAKENDWEEHEIARLVILITKVRELTPVKTLKLLQRCEVCTPIVLATLSDSNFEISSAQLIGALYDQAGHVDKFIEVIEDSLEQDLLNLTDPNTIDALYNTAECSMNGLQLRRFCRVLCDNTRSKKLCGRILNVFASRMLSSEATSFICETVSFDFFLDLSGSMRGFYKEIPEIRDSVEAFLKVNRHMDKEGELVDSDVDEDGNLCGFIDDDIGTKRNKKAKNMKYSKNANNADDSDNDNDDGSDSDKKNRNRNGSENGNSSDSKSESDDESEEKFISRVKQDKSRTRKYNQTTSDTESEPEGDSLDGDGENSEDMDFEIDIDSGSDSGQDNSDLDYDKTTIDTMDSPKKLDFHSRGLDANSDSDNDMVYEKHNKKGSDKSRSQVSIEIKIKRKSKMGRKKERLVAMNKDKDDGDDDDENNNDEEDEINVKIINNASRRIMKNIVNDDDDEDDDDEDEDDEGDKNAVSVIKDTDEFVRNIAENKRRKRIIDDDDDDE